MRQSLAAQASLWFDIANENHSQLQADGREALAGMTDTHSLRLVSSRPAPAYANAERCAGRYRVSLQIRPGHAPGISVTDKHSGRVILHWRGRVARKLLELDTVKRRARHGRSFDCDKALLKRLAIAGATASRQVGVQHGEPKLAFRQNATRKDNAPDAQISSRWSSLHRVLTGLLEEFPKQHLAEEDIVCLMQFRLPCIPRRQVREALSDLADWNHVQQITVPTGAVHYDLDTRPHLHVFDAATQELRDAPESGVLQIRTP